MFDGVAQFAQQGELIAGGGFERFFVNRERALLAPRAFQSQIRAAHQFIRGRPSSAASANPRVAANVDGLRFDEHRLGQRHDQRGSPGLQAAGVPQAA